jgi:DivIVA domain-containing protein
MPLMPADVANVAFSKPPMGKRGYCEDDVDAFLDLVEAELARLIEENHDLRNQVEQLDQQLRATPLDTGPALRSVDSPRPVMAPVSPPMREMREQSAPGGDHNVHAARVLGLAHEMAEQLTVDAQAEAEGMLGEARTRSEQLLSDARVKADGMVNEARTRAETLLNDARIRAETLDRQSREKAASLELDAARKHTEILAGLSQEKDILEKKLDELRTFERDYRARLKTYLDAQLQDLDERGSAVPVNSGRNRPGLVTSRLGAHADVGSH